MAKPRDEGVRITWLGAFVNLGLGAAKVLVGFLAGSRALVADGAHSLSDLVSDVVVLLSIRFANVEPDPDHPYGHGRIETVGSAVLGLILLAVAGGILADAVRSLVEGSPGRPGAAALVMAAVSIALKEWLYRATVKAGRRARSDLIVANAWHHRSDALSSVATLLGVGGAMLGPTWLDPVAAMVVAVMVGYVGAKVIGGAVWSLIDSAMPEDVRATVRETVAETEGVLAVHDLMTRRLGRGFHVVVHVEVDPTLNVTEGHEIAKAVRNRVLERFRSALDVVVHVDPWPSAHFEDGRKPRRTVPDPESA
jgi:cation diffusion facilitator family transporter